VFLVEARTTQGRISEAYTTQEEAQRRLESLSLDDLLTAPVIYHLLPDGSQRVVRDDGKPLQAHRHRMPEDDEEPLPLPEEEVPLGELRAIYTPQDEADPDAPADPLGRPRTREEEPPLPLE
jgi:hypothetical protein